MKSLYSDTELNDFNLTIVDDGSEDFRVLRLLSDYSRHYSNCQVLHVPGSNHVLSQLKNVGVAASEQFFGREDWLYLSDCDVYFDHGWLSKLIRGAEETEGYGFRLWGGQVHPFHVPLHEIHGIYEMDILDGVSWLMRWHSWFDYGPFERGTAPGPCQSEEYPFCKKLRDRGKRIGVIFPYVVAHTGLTQTDGKKAPGYDERIRGMLRGVVYE